MNFEELGLAEPVLRAVRTEGYHTPTPIQAAAIGPILEGRDVLGCAQTGTGKTAAFTLPTLHRLNKRPCYVNGRGRKIRALVLSPTRELTLQIAESVQTYGRHCGLRHAVVYGGVGQNPQVRALNAGVDFLVATPGRLLDLMQQGFVDLSKVEVLILDEADRMLDMGFLPDLRRIVEKVPRERQTLLFSATMPDEIRKVAAKWLRDPVDVQVTPVASTVVKIEQSVIFVEKKQKLGLLAHWLHTTERTRTLVFTRTKHGADKVVQGLHKAGIHADAIHGNKSQTARQRALLRFKTVGQAVLVATDIAARGLDIDEISHVVNFELPHEADTYVHRIGRTGRAGAGGAAVSFCDREERAHLKAIERLTRQTLAVGQPPAGMPPVVASVEPQGSGRNNGKSRSGERSHGGSRPSQGRRTAGGEQNRGSRRSESGQPQGGQTRKRRARRSDGTGAGNGSATAAQAGGAARPIGNAEPAPAGARPGFKPRRRYRSAL